MTKSNRLRLSMLTREAPFCLKRWPLLIPPKMSGVYYVWDVQKSAYYYFI